MEEIKNELFTKKSTLPGAGKGLFTKNFIPKGTFIVEYLGKISNWEDADHRDGTNVYIYYINKHHVIDAYEHKKALARYANDANGQSKIKGLKNNARYENDGLNVFIIANRDIAPGEEIFVSYGKEYWDVIRKNLAF